MTRHGEQLAIYGSESLPCLLDYWVLLHILWSWRKLWSFVARSKNLDEMKLYMLRGCKYCCIKIWKLLVVWTVTPKLVPRACVGTWLQFLLLYLDFSIYLLCKSVLVCDSVTRNLMTSFNEILQWLLSDCYGALMYVQYFDSRTLVTMKLPQSRFLLYFESRVAPISIFKKTEKQNVWYNHQSRNLERRKVLSQKTKTR